MDTSQNLLQEETLVIINFVFSILHFCNIPIVFINSSSHTLTIPYLFKQCSTDVHYGPLRLHHQAFGGI